MSETKAEPEPIRVIQAESIWRWSRARTIANSRLPQVTALIPLIGYILLWSDEFSRLLSAQKTLGPSFLPLLVRLQMLWWGGSLMAVGWLVYYCYCPIEVKRSGSAQDYVRDKFQAPNVADVQRADACAAKQVDGYHPHEESPLILGGVSPTTVRRARDYLRNNMERAFGTPLSTYTILLFELEYRVIDQSRSWACCFSSMLMAIGALLFLLPSAEVALRVVRMTALSLTAPI